MSTSRAAPASSRGVSLAVVAVVALFVAIYSSAACSLMEELELTVPGVTHLAVLSTLTGCALVAYAGCVLRDAGPVPPHWQPDTESPSQNLEVKRKGGNQRRFCQKCASFKPPRAHHCRVCQRCVLRMDHHCMWINNCVGHRNYKAFVLFLVYSVLALAHAAAALAGLVGHHHSVHADRAAGFQAAEPAEQMDGYDYGVFAHAWRMAMCAVATVVLALLILLLGWHLYLMVQNKTTIEHHEGVRARGLEPSYQHPYHLGLLPNLAAVVGSNPGVWLLPTDFAVEGTGLTYPMPEALRTHLHGMRTTLLAHGPPVCAPAGESVR